MRTLVKSLTSLTLMGVIIVLSMSKSSQTSALASEYQVEDKSDLMNIFRRHASLEAKDVPKLKLKLLQDVLGALEKAIRFFVQDYADINVDGLFGIRLAQGSIESVLEECSNGQLVCPNDLVRALEKFTTTIKITGKKTEPYLEAEDPDYFHNFYSVISEGYVLDYRPEILGTARSVPDSDLKYDETLGDVCFNLLIGTGKVNERPAPKCTITRECWDFMSLPNLKAYFITHQLLYYIFIDKYGCVEEARLFDSDNNPSVIRHREREKCRSILGEVREEYNGGHVDMLRQDLFLEQVVLCGMLGFEDFFADEYITMILSWQYQPGCFSMTPHLIEMNLGPPRYRTGVTKLMAMLRKESYDIQNSPVGTGRKLMREVLMEDNCLSHKTGLGIGTLGAFLRYLMELIYSTSPHQPLRVNPI
ncbi:upf0764 protein c16orf89 [Plakobranchus ocellatus]|uniref:Upf0764 protein c16orf89 n=1 Tax=Plakobranchus ocellatus TaxID=259542 RepID=A0AAV3Y2Y8_9GAST|nr:upf0764 protein c16orf89 [Plakobranchus ocellatus]